MADKNTLNVHEQQNTLDTADMNDIMNDLDEAQAQLDQDGNTDDENNENQTNNNTNNTNDTNETKNTSNNTTNSKPPSHVQMVSNSVIASQNEKYGMKHLPIYVSWENLEFKVPDPQNKKEIKTILHGLNGHVKPGELVAIIGPSGSGKSSLLNCIAGRNVQGVSGNILFNGIKRPSNFARFTGYVVQDVLYFNSLTVKEVLTFVADLKLPVKIPKAERRARVDKIITDLDLTHCQDTQIGEIGKGISGGERRRLAIGLEIINEPSLLLLDEPTSGLDSASALMVGEILQRLAKNNGITILCTIHQPRYSLAKMFDKLYFLAKGREMYFGPTIPHCLEFFKDCGYPCPEYDNPADFLLDLVNTSSERRADQNAAANAEDKLVDAEAGATASQIMEGRDAVIPKINKAYLESEYFKKALEFTVEDNEKGDVLFKQLSQSVYITPWYNQFRVVLVRSFLHKVREPLALMTQVSSAMFTPIIFGTVYWQIDLTQQGSLDRLSAISLMFLMSAFFAFDVLALFPIERNIFNRENAAGMYSPLIFYLGRTMAEMPQHIILLAFQGVITYLMYGFQSDFDKLMIYTILVVLTGLAGAGFLIICSAITKTFEQANLATFLLLLLMLFDGNWISLDEIPVYYKWIRYLSFIGFGSQGAIVNEYTGLKFECDEYTTYANVTGTNSTIYTTQYTTSDPSCIFHTGEEVLEIRGLEDVEIGECIMWLIIMGAAYRVVGFIGFWLLYRNQPPLTIIKQTFGMKVDN